MNISESRIALKEWAATCEALREGRQIVLLRKGGILDEDGVFQLEHRAFWLLPTYLHQDETLVRPSHRDLLTRSEAARVEGENRKVIALQLYATVERVFALGEDDEEKLINVPHIWSRNYLDLRFGYKPDHPLLCVALRVAALPEPYLLPMRESYFGCRSWIELAASPPHESLHPVLDEGEFKPRLGELTGIIG